MYFSQNRKNSQNEKSMRVPVLVYLILSQNFLHESLQKLILRLVAGLILATVRPPIFTVKWHWGARILRNFDLLTRARARTGHNMSPATAPCARAPGVAMRAPGSHRIFTVLAISAMRGPQNGWLAGSHFSEFMHAARAACMHSGLPACM